MRLEGWVKRGDWSEVSGNSLMEEDFVWDLEVCHYFRLSEERSKGLTIQLV